MIDKFPKKSTATHIRIYLSGDLSQDYLRQLSLLENFAGMDFSYRSLRKQTPNLPIKRTDTFQDFEVFGTESLESIYTDEEWAEVQLGLALIEGYKRNKGRAGYGQDYWRGKKILDNIRKGSFKR